MKFFRRLSSRRDRGFIEAGVAAAGAVLVVGAFVGNGMAASLVDMSDGQTWLPDDDGRVVQINPSTGQPERRLLVGEEGSEMGVAQRDGFLVVTDTTTGQITSIDLAGLVASGSRGSDSETLVLIGGGQVVLVEPSPGTVRAVDPLTLRDLGTPYRTADDIAHAVIDDDGSVWVLTVAGELTEVDYADDAGAFVVGTQRPVNGAGSASRLVPHHQGVTVFASDGGGIVQVGAGGDVAVSVAELEGQIAPAERSPRDLVPASATDIGSVFVLADSSVLNIDVGSLGCERPSAPAVFENRIYVPCDGSGRVIVLERDGTRAGEDIVVPGGGDAHLVVDEGRLIVHSADDGRIVVVQPDGSTSVVDVGGAEVPVQDADRAAPVRPGTSPGSTPVAQNQQQSGAPQNQQQSPPQNPPPGDDNQPQSNGQQGNDNPPQNNTSGSNPGDPNQNSQPPDRGRGGSGNSDGNGSGGNAGNGPNAGNGSGGDNTPDPDASDPDPDANDPDPDPDPTDPDPDPTDPDPDPTDPDGTDPDGTDSDGDGDPEPAAPTGVEAVLQGDESITVSWTAPQAPVTSYLVNSSDGSYSEQVDGDQTQATVLVDSCGRSVTITVTADFGDEQHAANSTVRLADCPAPDPDPEPEPEPEPTTPEPRQATAATGVSASANGSSITVTWGAASSGADEYVVSPNGQAPTSAGTGQSLTFDNLSPGQYTFVVETRLDGSAAQSAPSSSVTIAGAPGAPGGVNVSNMSNTGSNVTFDVSWSAATDNGAPITGYTVSYPGGTQNTTGTSISISIACAGQSLCDNGGAVPVSVTASNSQGAGAAGQGSGSAPAAAIPRDGDPVLSEQSSVDDQNGQISASITYTPTEVWANYGGTCTVSEGGAATAFDCGTPQTWSSGGRLEDGLHMYLTVTITGQGRSASSSGSVDVPGQGWCDPQTNICTQPRSLPGDPDVDITQLPWSPPEAATSPVFAAGVGVLGLAALLRVMRRTTNLNESLAAVPTSHASAAGRSESTGA